jgi:hypothetical protein
LLSTGLHIAGRHDPWRLRMAEHGVAVKASQPAKNSPSHAGQPELGIAWCWQLDLSRPLVVMSACFCPLRREQVRAPERIWGARSPILYFSARLIRAGA